MAGRRSGRRDGLCGGPAFAGGPSQRRGGAGVARSRRLRGRARTARRPRLRALRPAQAALEPGAGRIAWRDGRRRVARGFRQAGAARAAFRPAGAMVAPRRGTAAGGCLSLQHDHPEPLRPAGRSVGGGNRRLASRDGDAGRRAQRVGQDLGDRTAWRAMDRRGEPGDRARHDRSVRCGALHVRQQLSRWIRFAAASRRSLAGSRRSSAISPKRSARPCSRAMRAGSTPSGRTMAERLSSSPGSAMSGLA